MSDKTVDVTVYAQIEPEWATTGSLWGAKVVRMSQKRPTAPIGGTVLVKLKLRMSASAFQPLQPAVIEVPTGAIEVSVAADESDAD